MEEDLGGKKGGEVIKWVYLQIFTYRGKKGGWICLLQNKS